LADLVQNAANVAIDPTSSPQLLQGQLGGEAFTQGCPLYQTNAANGYWFNASGGGNALQAGGQTKLGIAVTQCAAAGQPCVVFTSGRINLGATLTVGETYDVSVNVGKIFPVGSLATNNYVSELGIAVNANYIQTPPGGMFATNTQHA
jgi:hypothetical protein